MPAWLGLTGAVLSVIFIFAHGVIIGPHLALRLGVAVRSERNGMTRLYRLEVTPRTPTKEAD